MVQKPSDQGDISMQVKKKRLKFWQKLTAIPDPYHMGSCHAPVLCSDLSNIVQEAKSKQFVRVAQWVEKKGVFSLVYKYQFSLDTELKKEQKGPLLVPDKP